LSSQIAFASPAAAPGFFPPTLSENPLHFEGPEAVQKLQMAIDLAHNHGLLLEPSEGQRIWWVTPGRLRWWPMLPVGKIESKIINQGDIP